METVYFAIHDKELTEEDFIHMVTVSCDYVHEDVFTYNVQLDFYDEIKVATITPIDDNGKVMVRIEGKEGGVVSTIEEAFRVMGIEKFHNPWLAAPFHSPDNIPYCAEQWVGDIVHRIIDGLEYYHTNN